MPKWTITEQVTTRYEVEAETAEAAYTKLSDWDRDTKTCETQGIVIEDHDAEFTVVEDEDGNEVEV
jgi:hypothetical protein